MQRWRRTLGAAVALGTGLAGLSAAPVSAAASGGPATVLVSVDRDGGPANGWGDRPQLSGDGRYVTFDSLATDLVPGGEQTTDRSVYLRDLQTGRTQLISVSTDGTPGAGWSSFSWPSDDGRYVAFTSEVPTLVPGGTTRRSVYVRDTVAGTTEMVSVSSDERPANGASSRNMISSDGRFVAFNSYATNLGPAGAPAGAEQVYLRDRVLGTTTLVSATAAGGYADGMSYRGLVSDDGRWVAFASTASNLVAGDTNGREDIFLRDMQTGTVTRISRRSDGKPAELGGFRPYLSPDGRYVVYNTYDPIVPSDTNGKSDVYLHDVRTATTTLVSVTASGSGSGNGDSLRGFVTNDGRYAVFNSFSNNLTAKDPNGGQGDVFVRDLVAGVTSIVSLSWYGGGSDAQSYRPVPSADGSTIVYQSRARNLVEGDASVLDQIYAVPLASVRQGGDSTAPTTLPTSPASNSKVQGPVVVSGTATDDVAVDRAVINLRDNRTGLWLQPDGTWAAGAARLDVALDARWSTSTGWSRTFALPDGDYGFSANAFDTAGNEVATKPWTGFRVVSDVKAPTAAYTSPAYNEVVSAPATIRGTAADDTGVDRVFLSVRDQNTLTWLQADGSYGPNAARLPVQLASPGATSSTWSFTLDVARGDYGLSLTAFDAAGNEVASRPWTVVRVRNDTTGPTVSVTSPTAGEVLRSTTVELKGTAQDETAVDRVLVSVRDNATGLWRQTDGSWGSAYARNPATVSGGASATWTVSLELPEGDYGAAVTAYDSAGNETSSRPWVGFKVRTDTTPPEVSVTSPVARSTSGPEVSISGEATDDRAVDRVLVSIRDNATGAWLQPDGTWGPGAPRLATSLTDRGAPATGFSARFTLPAGDYGMSTTAFDTAGNEVATRPWTPFTVTG